LFYIKPFTKNTYYLTYQQTRFEIEMNLPTI